MNHTTAWEKPVAIDLFAGGGGLTLGLQQAGFLVSGAVELDAAACETYSDNHRGVVLFQKDIRLVSGEELINTSPTGKIDLIAACPPCQGFSSLTSKYRRSDPRNELIFEFVRLVEEIRPTTIMMENVPGLAKKGSKIFNRARTQLKRLGYSTTWDVLNVSAYGVPQHRRRLVLLGSLTGKLEIPPATHGSSNDGTLQPFRTVRDAIASFPDPIALPEANMAGGPEYFGWHVVRGISDRNKARLMAISAGQDRSHLPLDLRPDCHKSSDTGFSNVYGRMDWDSPSPTITGGCATLSKGRFGHPEALRTISVREAATLQTFPLTYRFKTGHIDKACNIIGNALPPSFASAMAQACINSIKRGSGGLDD